MEKPTTSHPAVLIVGDGITPKDLADRRVIFELISIPSVMNDRGIFVIRTKKP